jgi:hypothetical protein
MRVRNAALAVQAGFERRAKQCSVNPRRSEPEGIGNLHDAATRGIRAMTTLRGSAPNPPAAPNSPYAAVQALVGAG